MDAFLPTYPPKMFNAERSREKKYPAGTHPQKIKSVWIKGLKNSCTYQITHPTP